MTKIVIDKQDLLDWRSEWLEDCGETGEDVVTPFDKYLYTKPTLEMQIPFSGFHDLRLDEEIQTSLETYARLHDLSLEQVEDWWENRDHFHFANEYIDLWILALEDFMIDALYVPVDLELKSVVEVNGEMQITVSLDYQDVQSMMFETDYQPIIDMNDSDYLIEWVIKPIFEWNPEELGRLFLGLAKTHYYDSEDVENELMDVLIDSIAIYDLVIEVLDRVRE